MPSEAGSPAKLAEIDIRRSRRRLSRGGLHDFRGSELKLRILGGGHSESIHDHRRDMAGPSTWHTPSPYDTSVPIRPWAGGIAIAHSLMARLRIAEGQLVEMAYIDLMGAAREPFPRPA